MKDHFEFALAIGSCILIGCGTIGMAFGTLPGLVAGAVAIVVGFRLLNKAWQMSKKQ